MTATHEPPAVPADPDGREPGAEPDGAKPDAHEVDALDPDAPGRWLFDDPDTDAPEPNEPA